jgi:hypothetical protein
MKHLLALVAILATLAPPAIAEQSGPWAPKDRDHGRHHKHKKVVFKEAPCRDVNPLHAGFEIFMLTSSVP